MANPVGWFEIYVQDLPRAKTFYEGVFQRTLEPLNVGDEGEMWVFPMQPEAQGAAGALVRMPGVPSGGMGTLVYFMCEDCAVEAQRVVDHGGAIHKDKFSIGDYGFIALAFDTEGNMIGLHSLQ
ncbi:Glyoxalase/bleomycin resistance protein/dioxygenase [Lysobacter dokdonensis DS-58]|uniref:Glyoxalase/bleomycin resistance protein/dioxygenase n=1 Tax=Lysobacter dokdonensis DS-58 TaxID=1300345 RepID=A0A0A2WK06_9GAMM|nr:VOC family protein [Lysobacter dokdonensis]KGQ20516.1 Glyoxalase/bleomycin resistance protein/dioxygenase [Lysobacter dokdonensis DS-58]